MDVDLRFEANCSILFTELPLLQRPAAAKAAGFDAIEFWWPWPDRPVPDDRDVDAFVNSIRDAGVRLVGLNFFAGDLAGPDCGVLSIPERAQQFRDNVPVTVGIGEQLGVGAFNALFGNRVSAATEQEQDALGRESIGYAAEVAESIGATVLVEAVSGPKPYPLRTAKDAVAVVDDVRASGHRNVAFLLDVYHLAVNGDCVEEAIDDYVDRTAHVQIADAPGRGQPGTGELDLERYLIRLRDKGYAGWVGLEYKPTTPTTVDSFSWLTPRNRSE